MSISRESPFAHALIGRKCKLAVYGRSAVVVLPFTLVIVATWLDNSDLICACVNILDGLPHVTQFIQLEFEINADRHW